MSWIEVHQSLLSHRKTMDLAERLDIPEVYAVGHLVALWCWGLDNAPEGIVRCASQRIVARAAQWPGDARAFVEAMVAAGFLERDGDDLIVHDWYAYAGRLIERRAANAEKQRNWRDRHKAEPPNHDVPVTSPSRDGATVPNPTVPYLTMPPKGPTAPPPGPPAAADVSEGTAASAEATTIEASVAPEKAPRAAPKPNKATEVVDLIRAAGLEVRTNPRDFAEIKRTSASARDIASAYIAASHGEWADDWILRNLSIAAICPRINGYIAWRQGVRARSPTNGKLGAHEAQQERLKAIARGEVQL